MRLSQLCPAGMSQAGSEETRPNAIPKKPLFREQFASSWCFLRPGLRPCRETHLRGQPLRTEATNAKHAPKDAASGVLRTDSTTRRGVVCLVRFGSPAATMRPAGRSTPIAWCEVMGHLAAAWGLFQQSWPSRRTVLSTWGPVETRTETPGRTARCPKGLWDADSGCAHTRDALDQ